MRVYRIARAAHHALDGDGARRYGGRWNTPGRPMIYTSGTLALSALEYLVHVEAETAPDDLIALTIHLPDTVAIEVVQANDLPSGWETGTDSAGCKAIGDEWLASARGLVLRVPSAPIPSEHNYLINPAAAGMARVKVTARRSFTFDPRLLPTREPRK